MKTALSLIAFILIATVSSAKAVDDYHLLLHGRVFEVNPFSEEIEGGAKAVQVIVYQGEEIYVAFYTDKSGVYEFNLPIGHMYEIRYGGPTFINKIVQIDTRELPAHKSGSDLKMDMGLFKPIEGADFSLLNEPFVIVAYNKETNRLIPDLAYTDDKAFELDKIIRKIKKTKPKK
ncbi:MAG: hypothetical protein SGI87_14475 [Flavobacteriales bacterium]|nr:hypothetical protein [Flavobacteriales bacterium]